MTELWAQKKHYPALRSLGQSGRYRLTTTNGRRRHNNNTGIVPISRKKYRVYKVASLPPPGEETSCWGRIKWERREEGRRELKREEDKWKGREGKGEKKGRRISS